MKKSLDRNILIEIKCCKCGKTFLVQEADFIENESLYRYITCPFDGRHNKLTVIKKFNNIKQLMQERKAVEY